MHLLSPARSGSAGDGRVLAAFYGTPRGLTAARLLRERLLAMWPDLRGQDVLGLGYAGPYLAAWHGSAARCVAAAPAQFGRCRWPQTAPGLTCSAEEDALPFPDLSFDRILIVHGLEAAENARRMLREVWRVLKDDGRLLVVAPNRTGLWSLTEGTPFGQGQPYSAGQIGRLLGGTMFRVERRDAALYFPPSTSPAALRAAELMERTGRRWLPQVAGVTLTEAAKDVLGLVPLRRAPRRRYVIAEAG